MAANRDDPEIVELRDKLRQLRAQLRQRQEELIQNQEQLGLARRELLTRSEQRHDDSEQLLRARRELEQQRDRYADLYDFAPVAYLTLDQSAVIREINLTGVSLLGHDRTRLLGTPLLLYVVPEDRTRLLEHVRRCRAGIDPVVIELTLQPASGEPLPAQMHSRSESGTGEHALFRTAITDLTQVRRLEAERQEALQRERQTAQAASQAKDQFLAQLSHELRTPLTPVLAVLSDLLSHQQFSPEVRADLEMVRRNVQMESRLIDDLLDLTRIVRGKMIVHPETVNVHELVGQVLQIIHPEASGKRLHISTRLEAAHPFVYADAGRLQQVLWNLLGNAVKFTSDQGSVSVITRSQGEVAARSDRINGTLTLQVIDSGIGIEPSAIGRLFEAFEQMDTRTTRRFGGLGLGLAISRGLIAAMGGQITAASEGPGKGSVFTITLPLVPRPAAKQTRHRRPAPRRRVRILLVEDHVDTARVMQRLLKSAGHEVTLAHSVGDALNAAQGQQDLLISDLGLPDGSGLDLMRKLRDAGKPLPGIALSGYGTDDDIRRSREAGFNAHLTKPVDFAHLEATIGEAVSMDRRR